MNYETAVTPKLPMHSPIFALCIALALPLFLHPVPGDAKPTKKPALKGGVTYSDDASGFVLVSEAVPDALQDIRYDTSDNFVGAPIDGYEEPVALLTREAAAALKAASDELAEKGYGLKIFDAYRPRRAVAHFLRWAKDPKDTRTKARFYPNLPKNQILARGYLAARSGHSRGSTVDLTLIDKKTGRELDMGGTFDLFDQRSHPDFRGLTPGQRENRMILRRAMLAHSFRPIGEEWWHFTLKNEPFPKTYFNFPVNAAVVRGRE